jgi:cell division protein ZapA
MTDDARAIAINIMGRDFKVAMPPGEERQLAAAVELVNRRMKEVQASGKVVGNERVAMLAALNIAHEFLSARASRSPDSGEIRRRILAMDSAIEMAMSEQERLL